MLHIKLIFIYLFLYKKRDVLSIDIVMISVRRYYLSISGKSLPCQSFVTVSKSDGLGLSGFSETWQAAVVLFYYIWERKELLVREWVFIASVMQMITATFLRHFLWLFFLLNVHWMYFSYIHLLSNKSLLPKMTKTSKMEEKKKPFWQ